MDRKWISVLGCFMLSTLFLCSASGVTISSDASIGANYTEAKVDIVGDSTVVEMTGGSVGQMVVSDSSVLNVIDGNIAGVLSVEDTAIVNLRGGDIAELFAVESSVINLYGYDVVHETSGGEWGDGKITGKWDDGREFDISLYNSEYFGNDTFLHVNILPEPATLILLGVGFGLVRSRHRVSKS